MKINGKLVLFSVGLALLATAFKYYLGPDLSWSGFSPVIAIALFAGMMAPQRKYSFILPLLALLLSDVIIHFLHLSGEFPYAGFFSGQWKYYLMLLACTAIGWMIKGKSIITVFCRSAGCPNSFFSNVKL